MSIPKLTSAELLVENKRLKANLAEAEALNADLCKQTSESTAQKTIVRLQRIINATSMIGWHNDVAEAAYIGYGCSPATCCEVEKMYYALNAGINKAFEMVDAMIAKEKKEAEIAAQKKAKAAAISDFKPAKKTKPNHA